MLHILRYYFSGLAFPDMLQLLMTLLSVFNRRILGGRRDHETYILVETPGLLDTN